MKATLLATAAIMATALVAGSAHAAFPAYGADTGPGIIITFGPGGAISSVATGQGPYDGIEDTYVGFVNNSGHTVNGINLASAGIGGFDGDGLAVYGAPSTFDPNGYGGPDSFFTNNTGNSLTVNFTGGLASGATTYISLEERVLVNQLGVPEPATWALMLIGVGGIGYSMRRRAAKAITA